MTEPRKLRVFLCHASQDKPIVRELYQRLLAEGWIDPWLDQEILLPGQDWNMEIEKAVETADVVIVFLSNNSITKEGYVQRELKYVLDIALEKPDGTIFVIPLRLNDCQIPRRLKSWQYVDYFPANRRDESYRRILQALINRKDNINEKKQNYLLEEDDPIEVARKKKMRIARDYYEKGYSEERLSDVGSTPIHEGNLVDYVNYLLVSEKDKLMQLQAIQSKNFIWGGDDNKDLFQSELVKSIPFWIRETLYPVVVLIFLSATFISFFSYVNKATTLFLAILIPVLVLVITMLGVGFLYRKLIDSKLKYQIKLQEDKIKALGK